MPNPKPLDTIHDLFAKTQRESATDPDAESSTPFQGELFEALAQLDYIYIDAIDSINDELISGTEDFAYSEVVSLNDLFEGLAQLATMGVVEVTDIVEAIHREIILRPLGRLNARNLSKWPRGITGRIYGTVRYITLLVGNNLTSGLQLYNSVLNQKSPQPLPQRLLPLLNIMNGVMGDHLVTHDNPLAIPMALYDSLGQRLNLKQTDNLSGRVVILCHGLCMSHTSWQVRQEASLSEPLKRPPIDATVLYLNYNTGQRISKSGRRFAKVLQQLVANNPDVSQLDLVGHSMGGLVARSALFYGQQARLDWVKRTGNLITLGSPHQGASLERIGHFVQDTIAKLPFANALAKLGDMRSAGIIDLRYGSIRDADWQSVAGRGVLPPDFRHPTRLPRHVHTYFIAATLAEAHFDTKATQLLGDGLVSISSALGEEAGEHTLWVPEGRKAIFYGVSHMNLINSRRVRKQVVAWLADNGKSDYADKLRIHSYPAGLEVVV